VKSCGRIFETAELEFTTRSRGEQEIFVTLGNTCMSDFSLE